MSELALDDLLALPQAELIWPARDEKKNRKLNGVNIDSRTVKPGEVFWAIKGEHFDGHDFIEAAAAKGAALAVAAKKKIKNRSAMPLPLLLVPDTLRALQQLAAAHRRKFGYPVLALTGSNGKTTTKEMIAYILGQKYNVLKTEGNLNNHIGCPLTLLRLSAQNETAVIELGTNHPGEIAALADMVQPDQALITNIGGAHLAFFASEDELAAEKLSLFDRLPDGALIYRNLDDPWIADYPATDKETVDYGWEDGADVQGRILEMDARGCGAFRLNDAVDIRLRVPGWHNVKNALAAAAVAIRFGFSEKEIAEALAGYEGFDKRMQMREINGVLVINDAYNANALSMRAAFDTAASIQVKGRRFFALGDMLELGKNSVKIHYGVLLAALNSKAERVLTIGPHFAEAAGRLNADQRKRVQSFSTHKELAQRLNEQLRPGDLLLLKGSRGLQMEKVEEELIKDKI
ncbi:MAG TPA: UDP-N-acetylmuramoyl-tripeptide--D-alanyl-D-alanine ligase [Caldithrix abyssi]|uniref:UDP-N-acetylmuramoyl-tripeptide--D-alanyl-D-alanine ligase n=1 Tax=Caldithrix abyssi TaxID=187145 RepID=A0A7V4U4K4_CALAY|nr:UDP-N-acetylmuramoyl-tripeptide--D-alanyl-D-alanine ligase [Caldithrix abyssi]